MQYNFTYISINDKKKKRKKKIIVSYLYTQYLVCYAATPK